MSRNAWYQQGLRRYHNRRVRSWELEEGDWVLRPKQKTKGMNKFSSLWEGPYWVVRIPRPGVARLETEEGIPVKNHGTLSIFADTTSRSTTRNALA